MEATLKTGKNIIVSTNDCITWIPYYRAQQLRTKYLYCVPLYPTPIESVKLNNIIFRDGFSDHTVGLDVAKIALSMGSEIIEKHFCISRNGKKDNPDLAGSMTPDELRELVKVSSHNKQKVFYNAFYLT